VRREDLEIIKEPGVERATGAAAGESTKSNQVNEPKT
jgi:hypothetical protein